MILLTTRYARSCLVSLAACLLAACGGGGDDDGGGGNISLNASTVSDTEIRLTWSEPSGISFSPYVIARADENSSSRITSTTSRSYLVAGLSPGTRYCFEIRYPLTGLSASNIACATTQNDPTPGDPPPSDRTPPSPPSSVSAAGVSLSAIDINWNAVTDESGIGEYKVFRDGTLIARTSTASFTDNGLAPATNHCYRVSAVDGAGNESAQSSEACALTLADTADPTVPTRVSATYSDDGGVLTVTASWSSSSDNSGIASYTVLRDGAEIGVATGTSFTDTSVEADTTYCYTVIATDLVGNTSPPSDAACVRTSWRKQSLGIFDAGSVALALDGSDVPQVAYKSRDFNPDTFEWRSTLSLVRIADTLELELLDNSHAEDFVWGEFSMDMALDASGTAHILHQSTPGPMTETLQYIVRSASQTEKTSVQSLNPPLRGADLVIDGTGELHACIEFDGTLYYGNTASGAWDLTPLDSLVAGARGNNCSIATDAANAVHIAFIETFTNDLRYASNASGSWSSELVDQQSGTSTNTIYHTSIATDSAGFAHIAYAHDFAENDMEYATNASGAWTSEKVNDAGTVGYSSDIVVDSNDRIYVLYEELADARPLHLATREGGAWSSFVLSSSGFGQDLSMSVDSTDALHIVFNDEQGELSYISNR
jgi:chitodextrinase